MIEKIKKYYKFHSKIYDFTRWIFLFGRKKGIQLLNNYKIQNILEIGCGTGNNIKYFENIFPYKYNYTGLDISNEMLLIAQNKYKKKNISFENADIFQFNANNKFDLIILSYSLTLINYESIDKIYSKIHNLLSENGLILIIDFYNAINFYKKFLKLSNVNININEVNQLIKKYNQLEFKKQKAYFGTWSYFIFLGSKK